MLFIKLQSILNSDILILMKKLIILFLFLGSTASASTLTCPRSDEYQEKLLTNQEESASESWCKANQFSKGANVLFEFETNTYKDAILTPLLQDNIHDMKWLVRKSTQDMREHAYCFELICRTIQSACSDNKLYSVEKDELNWCETRATEFTKIEQEKTKQVLIENQQRKSRSNLREKMRAIEVRTANLFIPLLQKFIGEYQWFTEKVPTFAQTPL